MWTKQKLCGSGWCGPTGDSALERILVNVGEKLEKKDRATAKQEKGPGAHAVADDKCE